MSLNPCSHFEIIFFWNWKCFNHSCLQNQFVVSFTESSFKVKTNNCLFHSCNVHSKTFQKLKYNTNRVHVCTQVLASDLNTGISVWFIFLICFFETELFNPHSYYSYIQCWLNHWPHTGRIIKSDSLIMFKPQA